jgi:hypothetical protein
MKFDFTVTGKQVKDLWIGWVQAIPCVNSRGQTRAELLKYPRAASERSMES